ncbi:hypothetical protein FB99_17740 [Pantoea agglomerans]|nr:hypothetical protein FB99_17740 [Pantoea agglomerans]
MLQIYFNKRVEMTALPFNSLIKKRSAGYAAEIRHPLTTVYQ